MLDEITDSGEWWLPSCPEKRIKGRLTFNQTNGAVLELVEPLEKPFNTIFGISQWGREITLHDCIPLNFYLPGSPARVYAHLIYLNSHFDKLKDVKFNSLHCQLSNLFDWLGKSGFNSGNDLISNISIKYNSIKPVIIDINPELSIDISFQCLPSLMRKEIRLKQIAQIAFNSKVETVLMNF